MVHIESRKSRRRSSEVEIFVDCECGKTEFNELIQSLKFQTTIVTLNPPENIWTEEEGKASFCLSGDFAIWQMLQRGKYNLWANILNLHCVSSRARGCALVSPEDLWVRQMFSQSSHVWFWAGCRSPSKCAVKSIPRVLFQLRPSARQCDIFCAVMLYYRAIYYLFPITESRLLNDSFPVHMRWLEAG